MGLSCQGLKVDRDPRPSFPDCSKQEPWGRAEVPPWLEARGGGLHADPYLPHLEWFCPWVLQTRGPHQLWFGGLSDCAEVLGGPPLFKVKLGTFPH